MSGWSGYTNFEASAAPWCRFLSQTAQVNPCSFNYSSVVNQKTEKISNDFSCH